MSGSLTRYEECLADAQRLYKRLTAARAHERDGARRDYERAIQRARELAAGLDAAGAA